MRCDKCNQIGDWCACPITDLFATVALRSLPTEQDVRDFTHAIEAGIDTMFHEDDTPLATPQDAMREYAANVGRESPDRAWILTNYDVWERNPFYHGPAVRHPEDDQDDEEVIEPETQADDLIF